MKIEIKTLSLYCFSLFCIFILQDMAWAQAKNTIGFSKIEGYEFQKGFEPKHLMTQLFTRREQFNQFFKAKPNAKTVDLDRFVFLVCASPQTTDDIQYELQKITKKDQMMEVFFISKKGKRKLKPYIPMATYVTALDKSLNSMIIYLDGKISMDLRN